MIDHLLLLEIHFRIGMLDISDGGKNHFTSIQVYLSDSHIKVCPFKEIALNF